MTTFEMATRLNGNQYMNEMTYTDECIAKDSNLVAVFGYSDDCIEFRGAIDDELGCYDGGDFWVAKSRMVYSDVKRIPADAKKISAVWCGKSDASWEYETEIPHDTFNIYEDGELYCIGIVFSLEEL